MAIQIDPRDLQCADVEAVEMRLPGGLIGELASVDGRQLMDDGPSQAPRIVQRRFVDDIVCVPGAQQSEEVQPALLVRVANQAKSSLPIRVQKPFWPAWRAPVSSTETQAAVCRPACSTSRFS